MFPRLMGLDDIDWETIIRNNVKEKFIDLNLKAFKVGMHCKGCGICAKVCKFGAITMKLEAK